MGFDSQNYEQIPCEVCLKPIISSQMIQHLKKHIPHELEAMKENGYKNNNGRIRKAPKDLSDILW